MSKPTILKGRENAGSFKFGEMQVFIASRSKGESLIAVLNDPGGRYKVEIPIDKLDSILYDPDDWTGTKETL
jgi:hypothetical protein